LTKPTRAKPSRAEPMRGGRGRTAKRLVTLGVAVAVAVVTHQAHARLAERRAAFPPDEDVLYLPPPGQMRVMSAGYREALADLVWVRAVIFAGDRIGAGNLDWVQRYVDSVVHLAPRFRRPYHWAGVTAVYGGRALDRPTIDAAIGMYRRGLEQYPEDHEFLFSLGMLLFREVNSVEGYSEEERAEAKAEGAVLIQRAASFGAPPLVRQLAATLVAKRGGDALAIQFLETQMLHAQDEGYQDLLREKLRVLVGTAKVESMARTRLEVLADRDAEFPYVSEDLYTVVRRPRSAR
jgi:hypothetical protein